MSHNKADAESIKPVDPVRAALGGAKASATVEHDADQGAHLHDQAKELRSDNLRAEQELKTREAMQRDHNMFPKGVASDHGKGNASNR